MTDPIPFSRMMLVVWGGLFLLGTACTTPHSASTTAPTSSAATTSSTAPWRTLDLQTLIDETPDGGELVIPYGRYRLKDGLNIHNRKHLTIMAQTGTWIYVDDPDAHVISIQDSAGIVLRSLSLRHWEPEEEYHCHGSVVNVEASEAIAISNSVLDGCGAIGVSATKVKRLSVSHCQVQNNSFSAFFFSDVQGVDLFANVVEDNANLLQMYRTDNLSMRENLIRENGGYWSRRLVTDPGPADELPVRTPPNLDTGGEAAKRYRLKGQYADLRQVVDTRFVKGKTTREEVRRWLGKGGDNGAEAGGQPGATYVYPGVGKHLWVYFSSRKEPYGSILLVEFTEQDVVSDFFWVSE